MLLLRLARHAVTIRIKTRAVTWLATMQRRRTSRTRFGTILVVNIRLRRSLLNRLRRCLLLSRSLSRRRLLGGRLRSHRRLLNRSFLLRGSLKKPEPPAPPQKVPQQPEPAREPQSSEPETELPSGKETLKESQTHSASEKN